MATMNSILRLVASCLFYSLVVLLIDLVTLFDENIKEERRQSNNIYGRMIFYDGL